MSRPLVAEADLPRLVRVDPDRHGRPIERLYELPLVPDFAVSMTNPHVRALYRCELEPSIVGRDPDGAHLLDSSSVRPVELVGWAFHLAYETNPIPGNIASGKSHWSHRHRAVRPVRDLGFALARSARIPAQPRIRVRLDWEVVDRRVRDEDNLVPCMKALVDGIRTAGVIPDDHRRYCLRDMPEIRYAPRSPKRPQAFMRLWIWREPGLDPAGGIA